MVSATSDHLTPPQAPTLQQSAENNGPLWRWHDFSMKISKKLSDVDFLP